MTPGDGRDSKAESSGKPFGNSDFVVVANRLPVDQERLPDGTTSWKRSPGGLVTALEPLLRRRRGGGVGRLARDRRRERRRRRGADRPGRPGAPAGQAECRRRRRILRGLLER